MRQSWIGVEGNQLLKVVCSSRQRNKQNYHELSATDRATTIPDFCTFRTEHFCSKIAEIVKCHRATVYRERARHSIDGRYCATRAHSLAQEKRKSARKYRITPDRIDLICWLLSNDWSPEQISNVLTCCNEPVSHEWIYRYVADDKRNKGKLYKHLRQGRKRYRKGKRTKGPAIKTRFRLMNDQP